MIQLHLLCIVHSTYSRVGFCVALSSAFLSRLSDPSFSRNRQHIDNCRRFFFLCSLPIPSFLAQFQRHTWILNGIWASAYHLIRAHLPLFTDCAIVNILNGWKSLVNDRKRRQNEGKKVTESAAISNHGWFYSRSFSHFYPECYQSLPLIRCHAHGMTPFRVIEFYAENIENKSNVTNFYAYVDVEDDSQRHKETNWENFRLFLTWKRTRFLHSKSIRCASRQSQMVARLIGAARNSNVTESQDMSTKHILGS